MKRRPVIVYEPTSDTGEYPASSNLSYKKMHPERMSVRFMLFFSADSRRDRQTSFRVVRRLVLVVFTAACCSAITSDHYAPLPS